MKNFSKQNLITLILAVALILLSFVSLFVGVIDILLKDFFVKNENFNSLWAVFFASRLPRLLALLCTGTGMSVAGLIMQQLCSHKFVSPTTGATISSAQFGILLALIFMPNSNLWGRAIFSFSFAILGTFCLKKQIIMFFTFC